MSEGGAVRVERRAGESICPFCKAEIAAADDIWQCPKCQTPHHRECVRENRRCAIHGCGTIKGLGVVLGREKIEQHELPEGLLADRFVLIAFAVGQILAGLFFGALALGFAFSIVVGGSALAKAASAAIFGAVALVALVFGIHDSFAKRWEDAWLHRVLALLFRPIAWFFDAGTRGSE